MIVSLFSYGTLRDPAVQRALFGRTLEEQADALVGFALETVAIGDERVVGLSGKATHLILRRSGNAADRIEGAVLTLTEAELATADAYETDAYVRIAAPLASGRTAFVYVAPDAD
jgi:hypothetical protein